MARAPEPERRDRRGGRPAGGPAALCRRGQDLPRGRRRRRRSRPRSVGEEGGRQEGVGQEGDGEEVDGQDARRRADRVGLAGHAGPAQLLRPLGDPAPAQREHDERAGRPGPAGRGRPSPAARARLGCRRDRSAGSGCRRCRCRAAGRCRRRAAPAAGAAPPRRVDAPSATSPTSGWPAVEPAAGELAAGPGHHRPVLAQPRVLDARPR